MPEEVLLTVAGLHVPATPLSEVEGRVGTLLPEHMVTLVPKLKVGVTFGFTVTSKLTGVAHKPADLQNLQVKKAHQRQNKLSMTFQNQMRV